MKKIITLFNLCCLPLFCVAQPPENLELKAFFSAMIVSDLDTSMSWYANTLGFKVI